MDNKSAGVLLLRLGLAFIFLYAGIASLISPNDWVGYLPGFISSHRPDLLKAFSAFEIGLGLWVLSGRYSKYAAAAAAMTLAGAVVFNLNSFIVTFRDIGLICAALSLFFVADNK